MNFEEIKTTIDTDSGTIPFKIFYRMDRGHWEFLDIKLYFDRNIDKDVLLKVPQEWIDNNMDVIEDRIKNEVGDY